MCVFVCLCVCMCVIYVCIFIRIYIIVHLFVCIELYIFSIIRTFHRSHLFVPPHYPDNEDTLNIGCFLSLFLLLFLPFDHLYYSITIIINFFYFMISFFIISFFFITVSVTFIITYILLTQQLLPLSAYH